jgi:hypothetical protein
VAERLGESLRGKTEILGREHLVYGVERGRYAGKSELTG